MIRPHKEGRLAKYIQMSHRRPHETREIFSEVMEELPMNPDKPMSTVVNPNLRYTMDSVRTVEMIKDQFGHILRRLATERALSDHRELVTADDVVGSISDALQEAIEKFGLTKTER